MTTDYDRWKLATPREYEGEDEEQEGEDSPVLCTECGDEMVPKSFDVQVCDECIGGKYEPSVTPKDLPENWKLEIMPRPCRKCGTAKHIAVEPQYVGASAYCSGCYDCDCDQDGYFSTSDSAWGADEALAVKEWNALMIDRADEP